MLSSPTAPQNPPHDVKVERPNGNAIDVSFTRLSIVEAQSLSVTYIIRYSPQAMGDKRQADRTEKMVPDGKSHLVVSGLDPETTYDVDVVASANDEDAASDRVSALPPGTHIMLYKLSYGRVDNCSGQ